MPPAVVFPGQGSQQAGAGRDWLDHPAWHVVERAEAALGVPLAPLLLDADADLSRTRDSQLSVLLLSLVAWEAARDSVGRPVAFAGHSLGQITALIASGAVAFDDGVRMAAARAEATQRAADARPGGMLALLGADADQAEAACATADGEAWPANLNAPGQIVVGGTPEGLAAVAAAAKGVGIRRTRSLAVGGAFHTPLMAPAADELGPVLDAITFSEPTAPVVANHDGAAHTRRDRLARAPQGPPRGTGALGGVRAHHDRPRRGRARRDRSRHHPHRPLVPHLTRPHDTERRRAR